MFRPLIKTVLMILCFLACASMTHSQEQKPASPDQQIVYTGRLDGYFRFPNLQTMALDRCPRIDLAKDEKAGRHDGPSPAAFSFIHGKSEKNLDNAILVGTGDTFAPRLEARTFDVGQYQSGAGGNPSKLVPANKELYLWDRTLKPPAWHYQLEPRFEIPPYISLGYGTVPVDNVGCFLSAAHYAAIVPGKHDFYFGPERLHQLARFLARNNVDGYTPVQMLAANLLIKTSTVDDVTPAEDKTKWEWPKDYSLLNVSDGATVYPWFSHVRIQLQEFDPTSVALKQLQAAVTTITNETEFLAEVKKISDETKKIVDAMDPKNRDYKVLSDSTALTNLQKRIEDFAKQKVFICQAEKHPSDITLDKKCTQLNRSVLDETGKVIPRLKITITGRLVVYDWALDLANEFASMSAGHNYGLVLSASVNNKACTDKEKDAPKCIRFAVHRPFFSFPADKPDALDPKPYLFLKDRNTVIFGVVDAALGEHVGVLNFSWLNNNPKLKTVLSISDPAEALREQVDYFNAWYEQNHKQKKFSGLRVLLTQMSPHISRLMAANFPEFQVVVSAADDAQATTELEQTTTWSGKNPTGTFVAVPHPYFDPAKADKNEGVIHFGSVHALDQSSAANIKWQLTSQPYDQVPVDKHSIVSIQSDTNTDRAVSNSNGPSESNEPLPEQIAVAPPAPSPTPLFSDRLKTALADCKVEYKPDASHADVDSPLALLKMLTLCTMRKETGADVALIQKRDFFDEVEDRRVEDRAIQATIDRAIWKGDLLTLLFIPGANLKQALAKSKAFDGDDSAVISLTDERLRGLELIGARFDSKKKVYVINEVPLDDKKIYTVATTDYIGAGDTGYPDLAAAALDPKTRAAQFPARLQPISGLVCRELFPDHGDQWCLPFFPRDKYLDSYDASIATETTPVKAAGYGQKFREMIPFKWPERTTPPAITKEAVEQRVQRRPIWMWSLKNFSLGYTSLFHNATDKEIKDTFAGVSSPSVTAAATHTWSVALDTRFSRSTHSYEFFFEPTIDFKEQSTGDETPQIVQLGNRITADTGMIWNLRGGRSEKRVGLNFSIHSETQVKPPFTNFTLNSGDTLKATQDRSFQFLPRFGGRWQNMTNTFEIGMQAG